MDRVDRETRSRIMSAIRSTDTGPERAVRERLTVPHHYQDKSVFNADFSFPYSKVALFVDGDYWHGKSGKQVRRLTTKWREKIEGNMRRDAANRRALARMGWTVVSVWESLVDRSPDEVVAYVEAVVRMNFGAYAVQGEMFPPGMGIAI